MSENVIDISSALDAHRLKRKEIRLQQMRAAFKAARLAARPATTGKSGAANTVTRKRKKNRHDPCL
jgi:hypothetical protein